MKTQQLIAAFVALLTSPACGKGDLDCESIGAVEKAGQCKCPEGSNVQGEICVGAGQAGAADDAGASLADSKVPAGSSSADARVRVTISDAASSSPTGTDSARTDAADSSAAAGDTSDLCVPSGQETCDGNDNDCDAEIDEGVARRCWADEDGDGFAATGAAVMSGCDDCGPKQTGAEPVQGKADCDDKDSKKSPGVTDVCGDKIDNDCDGSPDDEANNACGGPCAKQLPGQPGAPCSNGLSGACARTGVYKCTADQTISCDAPATTGSAEVCGDGSDNDCDGTVDNGCEKNACGGWTVLMHDVGAACSAGTGACQAAGTYQCVRGNPDATVCSAAATASALHVKCWPDADGDGYAPAGATGTGSCGCGAGQTAQEPIAGKVDCDDRTRATAPGAREVCDSEDNDCDGRTDEGVSKKWFPDCDGDGYGAPDGSRDGCATAPARTAGCAAWTDRDPAGRSLADCNDRDPAYHPGAPYAFGRVSAASDRSVFDFDCDGTVEVEDKGTVANRQIRICLGDEISFHDAFVCRSDDCVVWGASAFDYEQSGYVGTPAVAPAMDCVASVPTLVMSPLPSGECAESEAVMGGRRCR